jgi:UDP-3-O-acyl-N-acetylglucosamine deacetylase
MILQQSLKSAVTVHGIGLHSGKPTQLTLRPARANHLRFPLTTRM